VSCIRFGDIGHRRSVFGLVGGDFFDRPIAVASDKQASGYVSASKAQGWDHGGQSRRSEVKLNCGVELGGKKLVATVSGGRISKKFIHNRLQVETSTSKYKDIVFESIPFCTWRHTACFLQSTIVLAATTLKMAPQTPNGPPKTMSSRLLTMKVEYSPRIWSSFILGLRGTQFMQRAAAASAPNSTASTPDGRPAKRQRLSKGSSAATPTPFSPSESEAILAALAEEERKRNDAIEKQAAAAGETKWTLNVVELPHWKATNTGLQVEYVNWAEVDASDSEGNEPDSEEGDVPKRTMVRGRKVFRKVGKILPPASLDRQKP